MVIFISGSAILPFLLFIVLMVVGSASLAVDFLFDNWTWFAIVSAVLLIVRTIIVAVRSDEKWFVIPYFVFDVVRLVLTYLTLVWYLHDWLLEMNDNLLSFMIKVVVEAVFVLPFIGISIGVPWTACWSDDVSEVAWSMPLLGVLALVLPLGLRIFVEVVNTGNWLPWELLSQLFS